MIIHRSMAKTLIISNAEIKALTQSGASDSLITQWNLTATELLCAVLGVSDLGVHTITNERVSVFTRDFLSLLQFPVDVTQAITLKSAWDFQEISNPPASFFLDPQYIRHIRAKDSSGNEFLFSKGWELLVSYTAGYTVIDVLTLTANADDGETIDVLVDGVAKTWTFKTVVTDATTQIEIGADANATLLKLVVEVPGTVVGSILTGDLGSKMISTDLANGTNFNLGSRIGHNGFKCPRLCYTIHQYVYRLSVVCIRGEG